MFTLSNKTYCGITFTRSHIIIYSVRSLQKSFSYLKFSSCSLT